MLITSVREFIYIYIFCGSILFLILQAHGCMNTCVGTSKQALRYYITLPLLHNDPDDRDRAGS
jgi:hypothetical protein